MTTQCLLLPTLCNGVEWHNPAVLLHVACTDVRVGQPMASPSVKILRAVYGARSDVLLRARLIKLCSVVVGLLAYPSTPAYELAFLQRENVSHTCIARRRPAPPPPFPHASPSTPPHPAFWRPRCPPCIGEGRGGEGGGGDLFIRLLYHVSLLAVCCVQAMP